MAMLSSNTDLSASATNDTPPLVFKPSQQIYRTQPGLSQSSPRLQTNRLIDHSSDNNTDLSQRDSEWKKKREVYRFQADWLISSLAWSNEPGDAFHLAISSYLEDYNNHIKIVRLEKDAYEQELKETVNFVHPYPATKILWIPRPTDNNTRVLPRLIATSADYLRIWRIQEPDARESFDIYQNADLIHENGHNRGQVRLECLLNNNRGLRHCEPLTSFDWNEIDPSIIITASVDTSVAVWDIEVGRQLDKFVASPDRNSSNNNVTCNLKTRLHLHEQEVYDVSFSTSGSGKDVFASAGADGCVRLFDLRSLRSSSTVLFEAKTATPCDRIALVRVACNRQDPNLVSTFAIDSNQILILDVRYMGKGTLAELSNHTGNLNGMSWAPHSGHHICSASDDQQALIWELSNLPGPIKEPLLAYQANGKINAISWSASQSDWIAIGYEDYLELLRV